MSANDDCQPRRRGAQELLARIEIQRTWRNNYRDPGITFPQSTVAFFMRVSSLYGRSLRRDIIFTFVHSWPRGFIAARNAKNASGNNDVAVYTRQMICA